MGSCASTNKEPQSGFKARHVFASKANKFVTPSPNDEKHTINGEKTSHGFGSDNKTNDSQLNFNSSSRFVSQEETYFDTLNYLESDAEDDFYSVNGDFTPSRGNTPNYQRSIPGTPFTKVPLLDQTSAPKPPKPPTIGKKKLGELFKENMEHELVSSEQGSKTGVSTLKGILNSDNLTPPKSSNGTPYVSGSNSVRSYETTPNRDLKPDKEKHKATQCCMPKLMPNLSFSDKKKQMSPGHRNGG